MCIFIGKSNERISCKLSKSEILKLYSIVHVAMETTKRQILPVNQTRHVLVCELQSFSCHDLVIDMYSQTAKTVFSHLNGSVVCRRCGLVQIVFLSGFSQSFRGAA